MQTVNEIRTLLKDADEHEFHALERALRADTRKGVAQALETARKRLQAEAQERERVNGLYEYERGLSNGGVVLGLDEVGRGPLAGPLTVGGVILPSQPQILGLNDSKQIPEQRRAHISQTIRDTAIAWTIQHIDPKQIDELGMSACLRLAFGKAIADIESRGFQIDVILLDGNPLHLDPREINVVKGDAHCASIAAASIIAKVERDELMTRYAEMYPCYGFDTCKGYGSAAHIEAITKHGLSPIHRRSFCHFAEQQTLF